VGGLVQQQQQQQQQCCTSSQQCRHTPGWCRGPCQGCARAGAAEGDRRLQVSRARERLRCGVSRLQACSTPRRGPADAC
jgi:hypothetical protein